MKEKLIELLLSGENVAEEEGFFNCHKSRLKAELIAEYLIENDVIVLPCKIRDKAYRIMTSPHTKIKSIKETKVCRIAVDLDGIVLFCQCCPAAKAVLGKTVFLSREEAERALKGK